jgi:Fe-S-cluster-containing dehydrogenase component/formate-dependent nitrite reductase membrane component NrfD
MNYGFIIDNRKCIGCHACSTACKSENDVPLGVNRTWVKYVETGEFPHVRRHFQVTRCNHCANPPCVHICPTAAMYQRADGIVEFNGDACIGCKACMQACPYDAVYIDPDSGTAAKCHYCAHRTDVGLEPACVVVCPEHAIVAGDLDDSDSEISHLLAAEQVTVRKPEQGTSPKLFYIEGHEFALRPAARPEAFLWADVIPLHSAIPTQSGQHPSAPSRVGANGTQHADDGPIRIGQGRMAEQMVQVSYNAQHEMPWDWPVPAYLVTKAIGSGLFLLMAAVFGSGMLSLDIRSNLVFALVSGFFVLFFTALTAGLLILDLERPERFHYILLRPQWKSWLTRGAAILLGFSGVVGVWWLVEMAVFLGWMESSILGVLRPVAWIAGAPLAVAAAIYTAYLFGQAEGRDLWQSSLLPLHLLIQALMAGCAFLLVMGLFWPLPPVFASIAIWGLAGGLALNLFAIFSGELGMTHASEGANRAAHLIRQGDYAPIFWRVVIGLGHVIPMALLLTNWTPALALAGLLALGGLFVYEYVYVLAPQRIPNS